MDDVGRLLQGQLIGDNRSRCSNRMSPCHLFVVLEMRRVRVDNPAGRAWRGPTNDQKSQQTVGEGYAAASDRSLKRGPGLHSRLARRHWTRKTSNWKLE